MRVELRIALFPIKSRNMVDTINEAQVIKIYEDVEKELQKKYPFFSLGLIVFGLKVFKPEQLEAYLRMLYTTESHLIVGLDMVQ
jgi:hypothetical protein